jgi:hypothetical protein
MSLGPALGEVLPDGTCTATENTPLARDPRQKNLGHAESITGSGTRRSAGESQVQSQELRKQPGPNGGEALEGAGSST